MGYFVCQMEGQLYRLIDEGRNDL